MIVAVEDTLTDADDTLKVDIPDTLITQYSATDTAFIAALLKFLNTDLGDTSIVAQYPEASEADVTPPDTLKTFTVTSPNKDSINYVMEGFPADGDTIMVLDKYGSYPTTRTDGDARFSFALADSNFYADTTIFFDAPQDTIRWAAAFLGDDIINWTTTPNQDTVAVDSTGVSGIDMTNVLFRWNGDDIANDSLTAYIKETTDSTRTGTLVTGGGTCEISTTQNHTSGGAYSLHLDGTAHDPRFTFTMSAHDIFPNTEIYHFRYISDQRM